MEHCKCILARPSAPSASFVHFFSMSFSPLCMSFQQLYGGGGQGADRQTDRRAGKRVDRQADIHTDRQADMQRDGQAGRLSRWLERYWVPINPWLSLQLGVTCTHWPNHGATPKPIWPGDSHRWQFVARQAARASRHTDGTRQGSLYSVCLCVCMSLQINYRDSTF